MRPQISVIVPIYKVERYISTCIDSILIQTYSNLDIILVDDGSPDSCGKICDSYLKKDSRIRVIHKKNGGLSDARNEGLKIATGEFLCFVDSDDVLPKESIEKMYELSQKYNAQMVIGGFERFFDNENIIFSTDAKDKYTFVMNKVEAMKDFFREGCRAWGVLYHRTIHEKVFFPVGEINEDEAIVFQLIDKCETIVVTNLVAYAYRCREDSITTSSFSKQKLIWAKHCKENLKWIKLNYPELEKLALERYRNSLLWLLTEMALAEESFDNEIKILVQELKNNKKQMLKCNFEYLQDRVRMWMMLHFPFVIYQTLIRLKRKI